MDGLAAQRGERSVSASYLEEDPSITDRVTEGGQSAKIAITLKKGEESVTEVLSYRCRASRVATLSS